MTEIEILMQLLYYTKYIYLILGVIFVYLIVKVIYNFFAHFIFGRNIGSRKGVSRMQNVTTLADVINGADFSAITQNILLVIGASIGTVVAIIAVQKGYYFLKRQLRGS